MSDVLEKKNYYRVSHEKMCPQFQSELLNIIVARVNPILFSTV